MNKDKIQLLTKVISNSNFPIIVEDQYRILFPNAVTINATSGIEKFNGSPKWIKKLQKKDPQVLIIKNIDHIHKIEQNKLVELLKYKKIDTNKLNDNLTIILTVDNMNFDYINEEIISLTTQI